MSGAGKSPGTEELNISELSLESSVPEWGVGLLASTSCFGAGPGTGAQSSRPTCTARAGAKALQIQTQQRGWGAQPSGRSSQWHCCFASVRSRWRKEYRKIRDGFGSASVRKLHVRCLLAQALLGTEEMCGRSVKSSFPPKYTASHKLPVGNGS